MSIEFWRGVPRRIIAQLGLVEHLRNLLPGPEGRTLPLGAGRLTSGSHPRWRGGSNSVGSREVFFIDGGRGLGHRLELLHCPLTQAGTVQALRSISQHIGHVQSRRTRRGIMAEHGTEEQDDLLLPATIRELLPVDLSELLNDQLIMCLRVPGNGSE
jgi:hypothetical protein